MADLEVFTSIGNKTELDNYICVQFGLKFTIDGLQEFVVESLKKTQAEIKRKCPHIPCTINCSRKFGRSFSKWCLACNYWKDALHLLNRNNDFWKKIFWDKLDTQDIQQSYTEMAKVFIQDFHSVRQCVLQDLNALMSLFKNMNIFHFNEQIINEVRNNRNIYIAHNYSLTLVIVEKRICLTSLIKLMETNEVKSTQGGNQALKRLQNLLSCTGIPENIFRITQVKETLEIIRVEQNELATREIIHSILSFNKRVNELQNIVDIRRRCQYIGLTSKYLKHLCFLLITVICLVYGFRSIQRTPTEQEGCLSMRFDEHWGLNMHANFEFHAETLNDESIIDRKWLMKLLDIEMEKSTRGTLLTADMGYGKSTIVSNIVCAEKSSGWYNLRKKVLTYHFCRYDSRISTDVALLVQNIASAIIQRFPELGNSILSDKMAYEILYGSKCSDDPINCMEIGILGPLRKKWKHYEFIIIIDSLDECDTENKNDILNFLYHTIDKYPLNLRFLFTSRNIGKIKYQFKQLLLIELENYQTENENDMSLYIRQKSELDNQKINILINMTNRNFLLVKLYLQFCKENEICDFTEIPNSLEKMYQLNFERIFKRETGLFQYIRPVFEVLCTSTYPLTEEKVLKIANITTENQRRTTQRLIGDKLGHFLRFSNGNISLLHKSIADFLTDNSRKHQDFFIDREDGHRLFAAYFLNSPNIAENFVELVHHVALSGDKEYETKLFDFHQQILTLKNVSLATYLHQSVRDFDSYQTTNLLLKMISKKYINVVDDQGLSALFIAEAHGNNATFHNLLDNGANVTFKVKFRYYESYFGQELVRVCKYVYFCGYNILHISSQNGHISIVKYLLKSNIYLAYDNNDLNLNSFDVATENGHTEIAELFLKIDKQFANELSLYHASKGGHSKLVEILLKHGIKDKCLSCNGSLYWIPPNSYRQQQDLLIPKQSSSDKQHWTLTTKYTFHDDWRLITCETALHAAVRHDHIDIVKILLNESISSINCRTLDGKTVLMTAIQYNATKVFTYFLESGYFFSNRVLTFCNESSHFSYEDRLRLSKCELAMLDVEKCPNGASLAHMLAITDNFEFMLDLYKKGFELTNFDLEDSQSLTPLHYAFCRDSFNFITAGTILKMNFNAKSRNGSTPYHSGALCKGVSLYYFLSDKTIIPEVFDNEGRSILQYYFLFHTELEVRTFDSALDLIFSAVAEHNLYHRDKMGRNFLHYAAEAGNSFAFDYAYFNKDVNFKRLISQKDNFNMTPFELLFNTLPTRFFFEAIKMPTHCQLEDIFLKRCNFSFEKILSPHEYCIFTVSFFLSKTKCFAALNITSLIKISIDKQRMYPIMSLKVYADHEFRKSVMKSTQLLELVSDIPGPSLAEIILTKKNALNCDGGLSPLHKIISNARNRHWHYANEAFLSTLLNPFSPYHLDWCYDKEGYNPLHRAVIGGNLIAVEFLLKKGMDINRLSRRGGSTLALSVANAPYFQDEIFAYVLQQN